MEKHDINITFNRTDGSEIARFDNMDDAIIFSEIKWGNNSKEIISKILKKNPRKLLELSTRIAELSASVDDDGEWWGDDTNVGDLPKYICSMILCEVQKTGKN